MDKILLNKITRTSVEAFLNSPSHGLVIVGPDGAGKTFLAEMIASELLKLPFQKLQSHPYFIKIMPEPGKNQISIDQIRQIKHSTNLKTIGDAKIKRLVYIEQAELMGIEAQNALLKLLEEPSEDTILILSTNETSVLLPTVISRLQAIVVHPVSLKATQAYFSVDDMEVERAWRLSLGYPGLTWSLMNNQDEHELNKALSDAREILTLPVYERLLLIPTYSADKPRVKIMLTALARLLSAGHFNSITKHNHQQIIKILKARQNLAKVQLDISNNGNIKLNLLYLFTSLG